VYGLYWMSEDSMGKERNTVKTSPPFDADTLIESVVDRFPKLAEVFNEYGMACVGCVFSRFHSLADAAPIYHLDVNALIDGLSHKYNAVYSQGPDER
jgi:hybrid cluster-associated redox disulfide protein